MIIKEITPYDVSVTSRELVKGIFEVVTPVCMFVIQAVNLCWFRRLTIASSHDLKQSEGEVQVSVSGSHQRRLKYAIAAQNHAAGIRLLDNLSDSLDDLGQGVHGSPLAVDQFGPELTQPVMGLPFSGGRGQTRFRVFSESAREKKPETWSDPTKPQVYPARPPDPDLPWSDLPTSPFPVSGLTPTSRPRPPDPV